jgi:putative transposase
MPRPLRIEYENDYYHVINRGRGRQKIFHNERYFEAFITSLAEAHQRFGIQILCYCLMGNHYHLLVKTPEANLGRAMRHINGLYTQRYNRLKNTDGPRSEVAIKLFVKKKTVISYNSPDIYIETQLKRS